jgi:hypothetical protein
VRLEVLVEVPAVAAARVVMRFGDADPAAPGVISAARHLRPGSFEEILNLLTGWVVIERGRALRLLELRRFTGDSRGV